MPVSIIAGAQYGSEGKGKVAYDWAQRTSARFAVRVGGPNSGHTVVRADGVPVVFRQLPTPALLPGVTSVLTPGSYLNLQVLERELRSINATRDSVVVDPRAVVITEADLIEERDSRLNDRIGSTASGTGSAVARRVRRDGTTVRAKDVEWLRPFLQDTLPLLSRAADNERIIIEGTQGYGLSLLHGSELDYATSRDTTAAAFLSETGLSPLSVDEVVLVARAFPIRVAGNSGELAGETTWDAVSARAGMSGLQELTTVTQRVRRVGTFEPEIVRRAIAANRPSHVVLNHLDYVARLETEEGLDQANTFLHHVEEALGQRIDLVGVSRRELVERSKVVLR